MIVQAFKAGDSTRAVGAEWAAEAHYQTSETRKRRYDAKVRRGLGIAVVGLLGMGVAVPTVQGARPLRGAYVQKSPSVALFVSQDRRHVLTFSGHTRRCAVPPYVLEGRARISATGSFTLRGSGRSFGKRWSAVISARFVSAKIVTGTFRFSSSSCSTGLVRFRATHA